MAGSTMKEKGSMMNRTVKSAVAVAAIAAMSLGTLAACGSSTSGDDSKGKVYYLNFKPEAADQWAALAKEYTKEKGVDVKVQTAASGTYEQTLKSEIAKTEAPTLFQVNGPVGYQNWKKYTADMSNTDVYKELTNQDVALKDGDKVQLVGFGSFEVKKRAARVGRNPKTKESIEIPASVVPVFKAGKALKDAVAK